MHWRFINWINFLCNSLVHTANHSRNRWQESMTFCFHKLISLIIANHDTKKNIEILTFEYKNIVNSVLFIYASFPPISGTKMMPRPHIELAWWKLTVKLNAINIERQYKEMTDSGYDKEPAWCDDLQITEVDWNVKNIFQTTLSSFKQHYKRLRVKFITFRTTMVLENTYEAFPVGPEDEEIHLHCEMIRVKWRAEFVVALRLSSISNEKPRRGIDGICEKFIYLGTRNVHIVEGALQADGLQ